MRSDTRKGGLSCALAVVLFACQTVGAVTCDGTSGTPGLERFSSDGWGIDAHNTRFQPTTTIDRDNVADLELQWVYGLATTQPRSYPLVTEDTIFIGDGERGVVALDRANGCVRWTFLHDGEMGSAIVHETRNGKTVLLFADRSDGIYAVDAESGQQLWRSAPAENPVPLYSGSPLAYEGRVFVPLSSLEIGLPLNPLYGCCTTSGGLAAIATDTGERLWHVSSIREPVQVTGRHLLFVEHRGPSGAPVWGPPTYDRQRNLVFFGTGQNYSHPTTDTSDAVFAVDANDGSVRWTYQATANDAYNLACSVAGHPNCPDPLGPDIDFGAPPILATTTTGRAILVAGQKSGDVHGLNPDDGSLLWKSKVGRGGALGGVHWGMAVDQQRGLVYAPVSDRFAGVLTGDGEPRPGVHALDLQTGMPRWSYERTSREGGWGGMSAAIIATPEVVFAGSLDGYLDAIDAQTGELLWRHDSLRDYDSVNGVPTAGGAFDSHGPLVVDDLLIVSSGYESFSQKGGNALLVFKVKAGARDD